MHSFRLIKEKITQIDNTRLKKTLRILLTTIAKSNRYELEGARNLFPAPSLKLGTAIVVTMKISEEMRVSNPHLS